MLRPQDSLGRSPLLHTHPVEKELSPRAHGHRRAEHMKSPLLSAAESDLDFAPYNEGMPVSHMAPTAVAPMIPHRETLAPRTPSTPRAAASPSQSNTSPRNSGRNKSIELAEMPAFNRTVPPAESPSRSAQPTSSSAPITRAVSVRVEQRTPSTAATPAAPPAPPPSTPSLPLVRCRPLSPCSV